MTMIYIMVSQTQERKNILTSSLCLTQYVAKQYTTENSPQ